MRKVMFILNKLCIGGAEIQTINLINRLALSFDILLVALNSGNQLKGSILNNYRVAAIDRKHYIDFNTIRVLKGKIIDFEPQLIFTVSSFSTLYGYISVRGLKRKMNIVSVQHSFKAKSIKISMQNYLYRYFLNRILKIVFVSRNQMIYICRKYGLKKELCTYIHNGVNVLESTIPENKVINRSELFENLSDDTYILGMISVMRREKRCLDLLDAVSPLVKNGYNLRILYIGDGECRHQLERKADKLNLKNIIKITGFVDDVFPYIKCIDVSVLCSFSETLSMSVLESMLLGKPVIMTNVGGADEQVIDGENGFLYKTGDISMLSSLIRKIIDHKLIGFLGENSYIIAKEKFSTSIMTARYEMLINTLTEQLKEA